MQVGGGVKEPIDCNRGNDVIKAVVERKEVLIARDKVVDRISNGYGYVF